MPLPVPEIAIALIAVAAVLAGTPDARACSCSGPRVQILTPDRADDVPLNARVRFEVPVPSGKPSRARRALRVHGTDAEVLAAEQAFMGGEVQVVELTPRSPLLPSTQYEVAIIDPDEHPGTLVFGTFKTGTAADTKAPVVKRGGRAEAHRNLTFVTTCDIKGPWIDVTDALAEDPSRPGAQILWGVWLRDPSGKLDASKPPATILKAFGELDGPYHGLLSLGRRSGCDPHGFPLPGAGIFSFGLAPIDEAGNTGPVTALQVDMSAATPGNGP